MIAAKEDTKIPIIKARIDKNASLNLHPDLPGTNELIRVSLLQFVTNATLYQWVSARKM